VEVIAVPIMTQTNFFLIAEMGLIQEGWHTLSG